MHLYFWPRDPVLMTPWGSLIIQYIHTENNAESWKHWFLWVFFFGLYICYSRSLLCTRQRRTNCIKTQGALHQSDLSVWTDVCRRKKWSWIKNQTRVLLLGFQSSTSAQVINQCRWDGHTVSVFAVIDLLTELTFTTEQPGGSKGLCEVEDKVSKSGAEGTKRADQQRGIK